MFTFELLFSRISTLNILRVNTRAFNYVMVERTSNHYLHSRLNTIVLTRLCVLGDTMSRSVVSIYCYLSISTIVIYESVAMVRNNNREYAWRKKVESRCEGRKDSRRFDRCTITNYAISNEFVIIQT